MSTEVPHSPWLGLELWQNGTKNTMVREDDSGRRVRVQITPKPIELRFPKQDPSVSLRICAWWDDSIFTLETGDNIENIPFFLPGSALPDTPFGSGRLFIDNQAHNYFIGPRIQHVSDTQDAVFFSSIGYGDQTTPLAEVGDNIYLTVFVDKNVKNTVDIDEYQYVVLNF